MSDHKIPEGATHSRPHTYSGGTVYYKHHEGVLCIWRESIKQWSKAYCRESDLDLIAWTGENPPPDGTICELKFDHWNCWESCTVLCVGKTMVFIQQTKPDGRIWEGSMSRDGVMFRPVRTAEQIAADEERDQTLAVMLKDSIGEDGSAVQDAVARRLYAAGWRK